MEEIRALREKTDRMLSIFRASMAGATVSDLSREACVCKATARKYARILSDADMIVMGEEKSIRNTLRERFFARKNVYFALVRAERDLFKLTFLSLFPRDIKAVYLPYNDSLMPEDNANEIIRLIKSTADTARASRVFLGVITGEDSQIDDTALRLLCADKTLSRAECELLARSKEKERACSVTEYFFDMTRKARACDIDKELWQRIDGAEQGMIDALLTKIAEDAYRASVGRS